MPEHVSLTPPALPELTPARGERRARVAFLEGCVMPVMFHKVNQATVKLLSANGCDVLVPRSQGCCGAFHMHNGFLDDARERAKRLIATFERERVDAIVTNSAGCGSSMKEYAELFHDEPEWADRANAFAKLTCDVTELLDAIGLRTPTREIRKRATYHDACHLAHGQKVRAQPRNLLKQIPGLELVEMTDPDWCCGSAGIYNFLRPELASKLQDRKVKHVVNAQPELVITGNPGCHSWIEAGLRAAGNDVPMLHTAEVLAMAYDD
jgi:glycolate oxidase iron-sulfur subunit